MDADTLLTIPRADFDAFLARPYSADVFDALADDMEHDAIYGGDLEREMTPAERRANNIRLARCSALRDRAHELTPGSFAYRAKAFADFRYEYVKCTGCGQTHQRMDFYGNPHAQYCATPQIAGDPPRHPKVSV